MIAGQKTIQISWQWRVLCLFHKTTFHLV